MPKVPVAKSGKVFLGIDPGENGAAWVMYPEAEMRGVCRFNKATELDISSWFHQAVAMADGLPVVAAYEKVRSSPQMGVTSSFTFGWNYGLIRGILAALKIPFEEPTPQRWQKDLGIPQRKKEESQPDFKRRLRAIAQEKFPKYEITADTADALLIAEWRRRMG